MRKTKEKDQKELEFCKRVIFRIKLRLSELEMTQSALAESIDMIPGSFNAIVSRMGGFSFFQIAQIAERLKVPIEWFLVPDEELDELMSRGESRTAHKLEIELGRAGAEIRARDREIEELTGTVNRLREENLELSSRLSVPVSEITSKQLRLSIAMMPAVADMLEGDHDGDGQADTRS